MLGIGGGNQPAEDVVEILSTPEQPSDFDTNADLLRNYPDLSLELEKATKALINEISNNGGDEIYQIHKHNDVAIYDVKNGSQKADEVARSIRVTIDDVLPKIAKMKSISEIRNLILGYRMKGSYTSHNVDLNKEIMEFAFLFAAKTFSYQGGVEASKEAMILGVLASINGGIHPDSYKRVFS